MARLQGISGGMSGKTGSFTYRQTRGQTVVSQYQPIVKNPNTAGQQAQRAKFKLMSQLAAIMSEGFGTMGVNERPARLRPTQRNAFVSLNMKLATFNEEDQQAKIPMDMLQLTSSSRPLGTISQPNVQSPEVIISDIPSDVTAVRIVEVVYREFNESTSEGSFIIKTRPEIRQITDVPVTNGSVNYTASNFSTVLAYGLIPTSAETSSKFDSIHMPNDEAFVGAVDLNSLVTSGTLIETMTIGLNVETAEA